MRQNHLYNNWKQSFFSLFASLASLVPPIFCALYIPPHVKAFFLLFTILLSILLWGQTVVLGFEHCTIDDKKIIRKKLFRKTLTLNKSEILSIGKTKIKASDLSGSCLSDAYIITGKNRTVTILIDTSKGESRFLQQISQYGYEHLLVRAPQK